MKIIAAVIGTGIGQKHIEAIDKFKKSRVNIICEKDKKKIKLLRKKFPRKYIVNDENKIFKDKSINLVSIASYDNYHFKQIKKCIKFKKHIIVEKPMCLTENNLIQINKLLKKNPNIKITSNLVLRVNSLFNKFRQKVSSSNTFYIEADYNWGRKYKLYGWRSNLKNYSIIKGAAIHMIDLCNWLLRLKPKSVFTMGSIKATQNTKFNKESLVTMLFKYPNQIIVKITANAAGVYEHFHEVKIFNKNETIVNSKFGAFKLTKNKIKKIKFPYPDKKNRYKFIQNFLKSIINKKFKPFLTHKEQIDLMSICFAAEKSLKFGKEIRINYHK